MVNRAGLQLVAEVTRNHVITDVAVRVDAPREALAEAGDWLRDRQRRVFATNGFGQWDANDPQTIKIKGSSRPLQDRGGLLDAFTDERAPGADHRYGRDSVTVAVRHVGAVMGQQGRHGPVRNPAPSLSRGESADLSALLTRLLVGRR